MGNFLIQSVEKYLDLFGSKDNFTAENALNAILYHYQDIRMVDLYSSNCPNDTFILDFDDLYISMRDKAFDFVVMDFTRRFKFYDDDIFDVTKIRFVLYFEDIKGELIYDDSFELNHQDEESIYYQKIEDIKENKEYKKVKNLRPSKYELWIN